MIILAKRKKENDQLTTVVSLTHAPTVSSPID